MSDTPDDIEIVEDEGAPVQERSKRDLVSHDDLSSLLAREKQRADRAESRAYRAETDAERYRRQATEAESKAVSAEEQRYNGEVAATEASIGAKEAEAEAAENDYVAAREAGDVRAEAKAQRRMNAAEAEAVQLRQRKNWLSQNKDSILAQSRPKPVERSDDTLERVLGRAPSPAERDWVARNPKFLDQSAEGERFRVKVNKYHWEALDQELKGGTPAYYQYLDDRVAEDIGDAPRQERQDVDTAPRPRAPIQRPSSSMPVERRQAPGTPRSNGVIRLSQDEREAADISLGHLPVNDYEEDGQQMPGRYKAYAMGRDRLQRQGGTDMAPPNEQRADQRAGQRLPVRGPILIRTARNRFDIDLSKRPAGVTYEWKALTVMGMENTEGILMSEVNGWTPVPAERHPEIMGRKAVTGSEIRRGGQILMERPVEITREAKLIDQAEAANQLTSQLASLKLIGHRAAGKGIKKNFEPMPEDMPDE